MGKGLRAEQSCLAGKIWRQIGLRVYRADRAMLCPLGKTEWRQN